MLDKDTLQQLYRYCYSLTCNEHNAYDLLQTSVEKFIKHDNSANNQNSYIKRIIRNQFIDDCRRQQIIDFEPIDERFPPADFDTQTLESLIINDNMVEKILHFLNPDEREIIYFWAIEGLSTSEIAQQLETPKGTILSKIYRMRDKIQNEFMDDSEVFMEIRS